MAFIAFASLLLGACRAPAQAPPRRTVPGRHGGDPRAARSEPLALVLRDAAPRYLGPRPGDSPPAALGPLHAACVAAAAQRGARLGWDARLRRAARTLSRVLDERPVSPGGLTFALQGAGVVEPEARLLEAALGGGAPAQRLARRERFARRVARLVDREGYNRVGGVLRRDPGGRKRVVWVLLRSHLQLSAVPRHPAPDASILLRGQLGPGFAGPRVVVTAPAGETTQPRTAAATDGSFHAVVPLPGGTGIHQVEILATGPQGPEVLANFPLYAGVVPPRRYLLRPPGADLEAGIDHQRAAGDLWIRTQRARRARGRAPLRWHATLARVARAHSLAMCRAQRVEHHSPHTGTASDRVRRAGLRGVRWVGENVGRAATVSDLHRSFMQSPGHRAMRLERRATHGAVGVCVVQRPGGARQLFATELYVRLGGSVGEPR